MRERVRGELGIPIDRVVVGFVGRLVAEKGIPELLRAWELRESDFELLIVGPADPSKSDALSQSMIDLADESGVRFLGHRDDIEDFYRALDVFVLPSHREGFPRAAMEAAASGLAIVATDIRGCREVVDDRLNGLLVPAEILFAWQLLSTNWSWIQSPAQPWGTRAERRLEPSSTNVLSWIE